MAQPNPEPSMEDILASIKRIIAEDSETAVARTTGRARREMASAPVSSIVAPEAGDDSEPAESAPVVKAAAPVVVPVPEPTDILELTSPLPAEEPEVAPVVASAPAAPRSESAALDGHLISAPAAEASRNAFAALSQLQVRADAGQENTLEGLVGDLLRPMLREWLDRELPAMVERMVAAEIGRISGRA